MFTQYLNILKLAVYSVLLVGIGMACKPQKEVVDEGKSYIRFINLTTTPTRFYFDGVVNVNGDTAVYNFQGQLYEKITTDYAPLPPHPVPVQDFNNTNAFTYLGRYIDLNEQEEIGIYKFSMAQESYFPNSTHRVNIGSIINGVTYYKYAQVPSGRRNFTFRQSRPSIVNGVQSVELLDTTYSSTQVLEKDDYYTCLLAPVAFSSTAVPQPTLITIPEKVYDYNFKDSSTYVRFVNIAAPKPANEVYNLRTQSIDIYFVKRKVVGITFDGKDSIVESKEVPVALNLRRFEFSESQSNFFEIDMRDILKDLELGKDSIDNRRLFNKYRYSFRIYRSGDSEALNRGRFAELAVRMGVFNLKLETSESGLFLLTKDPKGYQTVIHTILLEPDESKDGEIAPSFFTVYSHQRANSIDPYFEDK